MSWPTKSTCFRCGTARPNSPLPPGPVPSNSRPARAPREQRHPGRVPGKYGRWKSHGEALSSSASGLHCSTFLSCDLGWYVSPAALTELQNADPPPVPKKTAQQQTKEEKCSQLRGKVDLTKQQLAKMSKRMEALSKQHTEVCEKVGRSKPSLRNWKWNLKKLVGSSCSLRPCPPRHLRRTLVVTPLPGSVRWLLLAWL